MDKEQFIKSVIVGDRIDTSFVVVEKKMMEFSTHKRAGEQFMLLRLRDNTGTIKAVLWDNAEQVAPYINEDSVVWITGKTQEYNGLQIIIDEIKPIADQNIDLTPFVPVSVYSPQELSTKIQKKIHTVENNFIKQLLTNIYNDKEIFSAYLKAPGGKKVHHNYLGGLAEHSIEILDLVTSFYQQYPNRLNWDLLVAGGMLHDIGKIYEYDLSSPSFQLTDEGKLIGHISLGEELIRKKISEIPGFPSELAMELRHMMLSHHGEKEWGSPEVPKTFNALCLFYGDLISSRLNQVNKLFSEADNSSEEISWTNYDPLLKRAFYFSEVESSKEVFSQEEQISFECFGNN
ncbi:3'-5' exoribonuclease YhaM family protein [Natranaerobius trueperi]|uniref:Metal-dependent phosphohydrolase n=1 Tax=Natranaerobius trueperi TaxID=759412 RepID=A0A226BZQ0_9FIRM|nr:OB-fold nucleic acid binding domain-containing protein [Natranaerobius trueperi]OWZ84528.1 metal-dependent phosphohydrolase [Natranaerobius trueperi]